MNYMKGSKNRSVNRCIKVLEKCWNMYIEKDLPNLWQLQYWIYCRLSGQICGEGKHREIFSLQKNILEKIFMIIFVRLKCTTLLENNKNKYVKLCYLQIIKKLRLGRYKKMWKINKLSRYKNQTSFMIFLEMLCKINWLLVLKDTNIIIFVSFKTSFLNVILNIFS